MFEVDDTVRQDLVHSPDDPHADGVTAIQANLLTVVVAVHLLFASHSVNLHYNGKMVK